MGKKRTVRFPSIKDVAAELRAINDDCDYEIPAGVDPEEVWFDVRLQVYPSGEWIVRSGDSSYDQDHYGFWGAGCVPGKGRRFSSVELARDLIREARDHYYQSEAYGG